MAKSDIILNDQHVTVKGELKVDNISSDTANKLVNIQQLSSGLVRINEATNKKVMAISQAGIQMFRPNSGSVAASFTPDNLYVGARGRIIAKDLNLSGIAKMEKIESSQVSLGGSGNGENPQNGKITMLNARGQVVLQIDAESTAKIIVPGIGDLIDVVKKLQARVTQLERRRP